MTPAALQSAIPTLQVLAERFVDRIVSSSHDDDDDKDGPTVCMETICSDYTSEIVQTLILGLDLPSQEEKQEFQKQMHIWLDGMYSLWVNSGILVRFTKAYQARKYLKGKILEQMDVLRTTPNTSTLLSNMMYAVDEDGHTKLTEQQVVDNALLLVAAGMETSSSTLTLLMMLLSLHPNVLEKLAEEQQLLAGHSSSCLSYKQLQESFPYLDAVVKEALRIGPVTGGMPRKVKETLVVDGYQIPKGWSIFGNYRLSHYLDPVTRKDDNNSHMNVRTGFQPERWMSPETTPSEFLAFGAGPR
jgi:cytochrome P450